MKVLKKIVSRISSLVHSQAEVRRLRKLSDTKDDFFKEAISDGLRHGSPICAKHMVDRREYLKHKRSI